MSDKPNVTLKKVNQLQVEYSIFGDDCFLNVTEWDNGEGFDFHLQDKNESKMFSLHFSDLSAITLAVETLNLR